MSVQPVEIAVAGGGSETASGESLSEEAKTQAETTRKQRLNFHDGNRAAHLEALYTWLPKDLHHAPNIDWAKLPSEVIGYLVRTVGTSPDAPSIALAIGCASGAVETRRLHNLAVNLNLLLKKLRSICGLSASSQLFDKAIWVTYVTQESLSPGDALQVIEYATLTDKHLRCYLEDLDEGQRAYWKRYALPRLPAKFLRQYGIREMMEVESRQRRKEQSDVLTPLYPLLVQIVHFRKRVAQRFLQVHREAVKRVESEGLALPYSFVYEETLPTINRDARTIAEVKLVGRPVRMHFILWNRSSWVRDHPDRYSLGTVQRANEGVKAYAPEKNTYFLQFEGKSEDLLWFGNIVQHRLLLGLGADLAQTTNYQQRKQMASDFGAPMGFCTSRPGLLSAGDDTKWFGDATRAGEMLFEPESLYRGILMGAALATIALTTGSRMCELLQVSDDRWETLVVDQFKERQPTGKKDTIIVQHLLPKGAKTEAQRQLFLMSKQTVRLLKEIYENLVAVHGAVPVVLPHQNHTKFEHLKPERYLFQWNASPDGRQGALRNDDVTTLLRFILHGLELATMKGEPIIVSTHLLRHVTATYTRHYQQVPPEAIALLLHHRLLPEQVNRLSISAATQYYSQLPRDQQVAMLHTLQMELDSLSAKAVIHPFTERDLEQMNEDMQAVLERWGTILPTAFGYCGCPGLCIRGDQRSLCIGCSYLVVDPAKLEQAQKWSNAYEQLADGLEAEGNYRDAKQKRRLVEHLDGHINMMRLQLQAEEDGRALPLLKQLSSPQEVRAGG